MSVERAERRESPWPELVTTNTGELPFFLTIPDVAAFLRTSRKAVYTMVERGQMPGLTKIGRRLLVRRDDLLDWLDRSRAPSPQGDSMR